jgi:hypothetical protein
MHTKTHRKRPPGHAQAPTVASTEGATCYRIHLWGGPSRIDYDWTEDRFPRARRAFAEILHDETTPAAARVCLSRLDALPGGGQRETAIYYGTARGGIR